MPLKDVTGMLMGDPGSSPRRNASEIERRRALPQDHAAGIGAKTSEWSKHLHETQVGWTVRGVTAWGVNKAKAWGRAHGAQFRSTAIIGTKFYILERVK